MNKSSNGETQDVAAILAEKEAEIAELRKLLDQKKSPAETGKKISGWLIRTPEPYNGVTAGYRFQNGRGFIPDEPGAELVAKRMCDDFGYSMERVEDFSELSIQAQADNKYSMIDMLSRATQL